MKRLIFTVTAFLLIFQLSAQENNEKVRKITVEDAVVLAADNNISLQRQRLTLDMLEKRNKSSWNGVSPSASLSGGLNKSLNEGAEGVSYSFSASVRLSLTPSLMTSIKDAKLKYESGVTSYEDAVRQIELNVRKLFYSLLYTKESMSLQTRNMETARLRYENNRDKYNRGQLSELDLLQSQYSYESQRPSIESAEITYQNNVASFKQILGIPQNEKIELSGSLSDALPPNHLQFLRLLKIFLLLKRLRQALNSRKILFLQQDFLLMDLLFLQATLMENRAQALWKGSRQQEIQFL